MGPRGRALSVALVAFALVSASCGHSPREAASGPSRRIGVALEHPARLGAAFREGQVADSLGETRGDQVRAALKRLVRERGGRITEDSDLLDPAPLPGGRKGAERRRAGLEATCLSSRLEGRDAEQILRVLAQEGPDLVIAVGPIFAGSLARVAADYPSLRFALIGGSRGSLAMAPNATELSFDEGQAAFLIGVLAAAFLAGDPRPRIGFVGGYDSSEGRACEAGFQAGAAYASAALRRPETVLSQYWGRGASASDAPAMARSIGAALYKKGARVVYHAAGASGRGVLDAASEAGDGLASGSGGAAPVGPLLASTTPRADVAMAIVVEELFATGTLKAGQRLLGLREGAIGLELGEAKKEALAASLPKLEEARRLIASGSLEVPSDDDEAAKFIRALK